MLKAKNYKNKIVATPHGNVKFNQEGKAESNRESELLLSQFPDFEYVEEKVETEPAEKKVEPVKKAPVRRTTRKKASDKKEEEK